MYVSPADTRPDNGLPQEGRSSDGLRQVPYADIDSPGEKARPCTPPRRPSAPEKHGYHLHKDSTMSHDTYSWEYRPCPLIAR